MGESEKAVRETFRKARQASPCVIFMDEIDSIATSRGSGDDSHVTERVISQLLTELDGLEGLQDVVVIAATNRPDMIDPALLRPGRFDRMVEIGLPDLESRKSILAIQTANTPLADDVDLTAVADKTEGYTGADLSAVVNEAIMDAVRELVKSDDISDERLNEAKVSMSSFLSAVEKLNPANRKAENYL